MPRRPPGAAPRPRGRPRSPINSLKPSGKKSRRWRDAKKSTALVAVETPCAALVVTPSKKMGRPLLQYDKLSKEGRRTRDYRARLAEQHVPLLMVPLLEAAAAVDAEEVAQKEADQAARWQRLIDRE